MAPTVSVIIPTYNRTAALLQTLEDLSRQTRPPDEVFVVDQSRDDDGEPLNQEEAVSRFAGIRYIYQSESNAQKARNRAIGEARGDILLLLDDDVRMGPTLVETHLRNYEQDPSLDAVAGQVMFKDVPA